MYTHLTCKAEGAAYLREILNTYVDLSTYNEKAYIKAKPHPTWEGRESFEVSFGNAGVVRGIDVLWANLKKDVALFAENNPDFDICWAHSCHRDIGDWFAADHDSIYFNLVRQDQYHVREVYEAINLRGHVGFCEFKRISGLRVFGEPNQARKVAKLIIAESKKKDPFLDLRQGQAIMDLCGLHVIILLETDKGHFQLINDTIYSTAMQLHCASNSPWKGADYSFLDNHPVFQ